MQRDHCFTTDLVSHMCEASWLAEITFQQQGPGEEEWHPGEGGGSLVGTCTHDCYRHSLASTFMWPTEGVLPLCFCLAATADLQGPF